jgi:hypothetical protein
MLDEPRIPREDKNVVRAIPNPPEPGRNSQISEKKVNFSHVEQETTDPSRRSRRKCWGEKKRKRRNGRKKINQRAKDTKMSNIVGDEESRDAHLDISWECDYYIDDYEPIQEWEFFDDLSVW